MNKIGCKIGVHCQKLVRLYTLCEIYTIPAQASNTGVDLASGITFVTVNCHMLVGGVHFGVSGLSLLLLHTVTAILIVYGSSIIQASSYSVCIYFILFYLFYFVVFLCFLCSLLGA